MAPVPWQRFELIRLSSNGGRGSFSFADTKVFGDRKLRAVEPLAKQSGRDSDVPQIVIPGAGGGAKVNPQLRFGSYAPGFSPHGLVLIRLTRVE